MVAGSYREVAGRQEPTSGIFSGTLETRSWRTFGTCKLLPREHRSSNVLSWKEAQVESKLWRVLDLCFRLGYSRLRSTLSRNSSPHSREFAGFNLSLTSLHILEPVHPNHQFILPPQPMALGLGCISRWRESPAPARPPCAYMLQDAA